MTLSERIVIFVLIVFTSLVMSFAVAELYHSKPEITALEQLDIEYKRLAIERLKLEVERKRRGER